MRKTVQIGVMSVVWLLASPSLQLGKEQWLEVGAPPAMAEATKPQDQAEKPKKAAKKKVVRKPARGSSAGIPRSVAPGFHPMQPITPPETPSVTGTVTAAPPVRGFEQVPTMPIVPRGSTAGAGVETSQDRVARCTYQAAGVPGSQQGAYIHNCAF